MINRIENDHRRFRDIVRGRIRENLRKYISRGDVVAPNGDGTVSIPMPHIDVPRFTHGSFGAGWQAHDSAFGCTHASVLPAHPDFDHASNRLRVVDGRFCPGLRQLLHIR